MCSCLDADMILSRPESVRINRHHRSSILIRRLGCTFITFLSGIIIFFIIVDKALLAENLLVLSTRFSMFQVKDKEQALPFPSTRFLLDEYEYAWDNIKPGEHCLRYATREYTARLLHVSGSSSPSEAMRACKETTIEIHGKVMKTDWCLDLVCRL